MSSTRHKITEGPFKQERWASDPAMPNAINGLLVAKRCSVLRDENLKSLIWFIQAESLRLGGLHKLVTETALFRFQNPKKAHLHSVELALIELCLNPGSTTIEGDATGTAIRKIRESRMASAVAQIAHTQVSSTMREALDFCLGRRRMIRIEGLPGVGKSATLHSWVKAQGGLARYVEVPSSSDDRSFYVAIANALGIARGAAFNGQQIKLRIEEALRLSGLLLALDESQFLFAQYIRPRGTPDRIQWIKTMFDAGVPIAMVSTPDFSKWQKWYVEKTMWNDDQLERRINRKVSLVSELSQSDLLAIARKLHPGGDDRTWLLLAGYARACVKKNASAIEEVMESAFHLVKNNGRQKIEFSDIEEALERFHFPGDGLPSFQKTTAGHLDTIAPTSRKESGLMLIQRDLKAPKNPFRRIPAIASQACREVTADSLE